MAKKQMSHEKRLAHQAKLAIRADEDDRVMMAVSMGRVRFNRMAYGHRVRRRAWLGNEDVTNAVNRLRNAGLVFFSDREGMIADLEAYRATVMSRARDWP